MRIPDRPSAFTSDTARTKYLAAYDQAFTRLWPVPVQPSDIDTGLGQVRVYQTGRAEGDPIVLLSGAGANALAWYRYLEPLGGHRPVIAIDPLGEPGHSIQSAPIRAGSDVAAWLSDVLAALGVTNAHVVGSSFGGWTALQQQLTGGGRVAALTLIDPAGFPPTIRRFYRWIILGGMAALLPRRMRRALSGPLGNGTLLEDDLMGLVKAGRTFRRRMPMSLTYSGDELRSVPVPVQVLLGGRSTLHDTAAVSEWLAQELPKWRTEVVPGAGHALPIEAPELVVDRILTFSGHVSR